MSLFIKLVGETTFFTDSLKRHRWSAVKVMGNDYTCWSLEIRITQNLKFSVA